MQYLTSELYRARSIDSRFFKISSDKGTSPLITFFYFYTVEELNVYFPITKDRYPLITPAR